MKNTVSLIVIVLLLLAMTHCASSPESLPTVTAVPTSSPTPVPTTTPIPVPTPTMELGLRPVDIGGYELYIRCEGEGSPAVIIDARLGSTGLSAWKEVQTLLKDITLTCTYNRAGLTLSDDGPIPRTSQTIVDELKTLLKNAGIPGPCVLVGHGFGGFNVRLYADQNPDEVAGIVLVDSSHEDQEAWWLEHMSPELQQALEGEDIEGVDWSASSAEVADTKPFGDLPLIVISRGKAELIRSYFLPAEVRDEYEALRTQFEAEVWPEFQTDFLSLSTNSTQIIAEKSGHDVHSQQPELIVDAVRQVVEMARVEE